MRVLIIVIAMTWSSLWSADYRLAAPERVTFSASGNFTLVGTWYGVEHPSAPGVILVHMLGRNRGDWNTLARYIQKEGIAVLSYDLRGHGESTAKGTVTWKTFAQPEYRQSIDDLSAAHAYIVSRGCDPARIGLIGMDLGANYALSYASVHSTIATLILIAPGRARKGVPGIEQVGKYGNRPLYALYTNAAKNKEQIQTLRESVKGLLKVDVYGNGLNSTVIFKNQLMLAKNVTQWLNQSFEQSKQ